MKAVSALRVKRGLHRVNGAEPQVVGLTPQTTDIRKTDTMRTYILRPPKTVERQKSIRSPRPKPAAPAAITEIKAEGEPTDNSRRGVSNEGRSRTGFISGGFHRQTLSPTHHSVSGLPSHLILLGLVWYPLITHILCFDKPLGFRTRPATP